MATQDHGRQGRSTRAPIGEAASRLAIAGLFLAAAAVVVLVAWAIFLSVSWPAEMAFVTALAAAICSIGGLIRTQSTLRGHGYAVAGAALSALVILLFVCIWMP